ncbi:MAG: protein adenylyltransferase SelO [Polyangiales bacterium]
MYTSLDQLSFDDSFVRALPADPILTNQRRQVGDVSFSRVQPTAVSAPRLIAHAQEVADLLELSPAACASQAFVDVFSGNRLLPGMDPYAACYGGHQFGHWAGQLGDGRAITLGELVTGAGRWELQLKGAGPTPYSRTADGRAVLRSSLREFLCSEAMHHLGIPTTRALSLITTGEQVVRDMFYDGHPRAEPGAVVCRVSPSFVRFGHFEILAARGLHDTLRALADYVIGNHHSQFAALPESERYLRWFEHVAALTCDLVVHWMRVGFVHGVMNTDNMSVLGLTIDYGPYGFLDVYDPGWTPNTTDAGGRRYRYANQPDIALWNLSCLASALVPLVGQPAPLEAALHRAVDQLSASLARMFCAKLGLEQRGDAASVAEGLSPVLHACSLDMTNFYRALADLPEAPLDETGDATRVAYLLDRDDVAYAPLTTPERGQLAAWLRGYARELKEQGLPREQRRASMQAQNPRFLLRNYMAQLAIDQAEAGDTSLVHELLALIRAPYADQPEHARWAAKRPDWAAQRAGCSMLSCSS